MPQQDDIFFEEEQPNSNETMGGDSSFPGEEPEPEKPKGGGANRRTLMLLVLLLAIAAAGAYVFIMPSTEPEIVQTPAPAKKKVVKLPVRKVPEAKPKPVVQPEPAPVAQVQAKPEQKPVPAQQAVKKVVLPESPVAAVETVAKPPVTPAQVEEAEKAVAPAQQPYTLQVGAYILESNVKEASKAVENLGYAPRLLQGKKTVEMTRLLVGRFDTGAQGQARLDELRALAPDAFAVWENKQMTVYAGSYFSLDRARSFADRLYAEGVRVEEVKATVQVDITTMQFGDFADRASAEKAVAGASDAGLEVLVVKTR